ncbi:MAG: hypothetical protein M3P50_02425 [Actinomycetota bacterium]|nr:hypothetical protein [Actinomycetota bacterium]
MVAHASAEPADRGELSDREWGRQRGARPPLDPRAVLGWWAATAAVLVAVIVGVVGGPGPLDDPDPGQQRPGILADPGEAPLVGAVDLPGDPLGRRPVFVLFDRRGYDADRVQRVLEEVPDRFAFVLVVPSRPTQRPPQRVSVLVDPGRRVADAVGLSEPLAGGFPSGYAVIDKRRRVRYATLAPAYPENAFEIHIVTEPLI